VSHKVNALRARRVDQCENVALVLDCAVITAEARASAIRVAPLVRCQCSESCLVEKWRHPVIAVPVGGEPVKEDNHWTVEGSAVGDVEGESGARERTKARRGHRISIRHV
jgi:hypothetical protein